ncbi:MAG TPA: desulfoferrodoxin [Candidatus Diapherotrites archaeon]|nr:desulfoferrodoxin [Candidatus Diapherotrites archaeon]
MVKKGEIYRCTICGNVVEVIDAGGGTLVCCGQNMDLHHENTSEDQLKEKHVPVIEKTRDAIIVRVGEITHPMTEEHHIKWIEVNIDGAVYVKKLNIGDEPVAEFKASGYKVSARCLCNIHGVWKSQ